LSKTEISEIKEIVHDVFGFYEINFDWLAKANT
jgi:hypothetical protein